VAEPGFRPRGAWKFSWGATVANLTGAAKTVRKFLTTFFYSFLLFFTAAPPASIVHTYNGGGGGGAVQGVLGAPSFLARAPGGARCPPAPWLRHCLTCIIGATTVGNMGVRTPQKFWDSCLDDNTMQQCWGGTRLLLPSPCQIVAHKYNGTIHLEHLDCVNEKEFAIDSFEKNDDRFLDISRINV
jgi:hypothetical protein